ncbi:MAG TPA: hypothetical protein VKP69_28705 [Isosphaeraceae bacterium]|nr:hypothetical protein [Isosphaeraceae bacterium]
MHLLGPGGPGLLDLFVTRPSRSLARGVSHPWRHRGSRRIEGGRLAASVPRSIFPRAKERLAQLGPEVFAAGRATPFGRFFFRDPNGYVVEGGAPEIWTRVAVDWPVRSNLPPLPHRWHVS